MARNDIKELFLAHRRELQNYLTRKLRDGETAADLAQEAFLRFAEHGPTNGIAHPRSYLFRTAHNLAVDHVRREQRNRTDPVAAEELAEVADERATPDRTTEARDELARTREALLELPERTRQVFALTRLEGLTYAVVAKRLQISDSSVQKHLAKAIKHVMKRLRSGP